MYALDSAFLISKVEGDVQLHHKILGWVNAEAGMTFPAGVQIAIKTGSDGRTEIINAAGQRLEVDANKHICVDDLFDQDDIDTLRFIKVTARDMMAARIPVPLRISPAT